MTEPTIHIWRTKTSIRDGSPTGRFVVDWTEAEDALDEARESAREPGLDVERLAEALRRIVDGQGIWWGPAPGEDAELAKARDIAREYAALASEDRP